MDNKVNDVYYAFNGDVARQPMKVGSTVADLKIALFGELLPAELSNIKVGKLNSINLLPTNTSGDEPLVILDERKSG